MSKDKNYSLNIHHRKVKIDQKSEEKHPAQLSAGHFYFGLEEDGKVTFFTNYPEKMEFLSNLINGKELYMALEEVYKDIHDIEKKSLLQWITTRSINLSQEQFTKAYKYAQEHQERQIEESYDGGLQSAALIQAVYHAAGLPLHFTSVYTKAELTNFSTPVAKNILVRYGSRDTFEKDFRNIPAVNKTELAMRLNIPEKTIITKGIGKHEYTIFSILVKEIDLPNNQQILNTETQDRLQSSLNNYLKTSLPYTVPCAHPITSLEKKHLENIIHCSILYINKKFISKGPDILKTTELQRWLGDMMVDYKVYTTVMLYLNAIKFNEFVKPDEIANHISSHINKYAEKCFDSLITIHNKFENRLELGPPKDSKVTSKIKKYFAKKSTEEAATTEWQSQLEASLEKTTEDLGKNFNQLAEAIRYDFEVSMARLANHFNILELLEKGRFPERYNPKILCNETTDKLSNFSQEMLINATVPNGVEHLGELTYISGPELF